jgi:hypothetical protein
MWPDKPEAGMTLPPLICEWNGDAFVPRAHLKTHCDEELTVHELYRLEIREERSQASHNHYHAAIHEVWLNLPEDKAARWPSPDHLRKWALIKAGYRDERSIVASSKAEAQRIAAFVRPIDTYAVVLVKDACVLVYTARSQKYRAMGKKDFEASKAAVLDVIAQEIGMSVEDLGRNAGKAA